jgi:hypothetical protein
MTITEADITIVERIIERRKINHPNAPWEAVAKLALLSLDQEPPVLTPTQAQAKKLFSSEEYQFKNVQLPEIVRLSTQVITSATHG